MSGCLALFWLMILSSYSLSPSYTFRLPMNETSDPLTTVLKAANLALKGPRMARTSVIVLTDLPQTEVLKEKVLAQLDAPYGIGLFQAVYRSHNNNETLQRLRYIISLARNLRKQSWDMTILVLSKDPSFLAWFAQTSLNNRLLSATTKLIVLTQLSLEVLKQLVELHWTFAMMNTLIINVDQMIPYVRCNFYVHYPYSPNGSQMKLVAHWSEKQHLAAQESTFFPAKYKNFYGAIVNVSALDYKPVWYTIQEQLKNGTKRDKLTGMDYLLLETAAKSLNFTINLLIVSSWAEALERVIERAAFITPAYHAILVDRLKRFDYTIGFTYVRISFSMAKPRITPNWLSLYNPLTHEVWASTLLAVLLTPPIVFLLMRAKFLSDDARQKSFGWVFMTIFGSLLGQPMANILMIRSASRVALAAWFWLAFIMVSVYRGNLTAFLTLPKFPPRAETLDDLVRTADRITMEPWGKDYKASFKQSGIQVMENIADLMEVGPTLKDGLWQSLHKKQAQFDTRHSLLVAISEHFTTRDGTSRFYMGRETVLPGLSGWPIPHDAPFKPDLDWCILSSIEAGLYDKWTDDMLSLTRQETRKKKREFEQHKTMQGAEEYAEDLEESGGDKKIALTIVHMQGPLMLLVIGVSLAAIVFVIEKATYSPEKY